MKEHQYRTTEVREQQERKVVATAHSSIWKGLLLTACITLLFSPSYAFAWNGGCGIILPWRRSASPHSLLAASPRNDADAGSSSSTSRSDDSSAAIKGVTLKIALDANGGAADLADIKLGRFTSPESLDMVHRLRVVSDAVLVGRGTVQEDDCTLTVRRVPLGDGRPQPIRVVLDPRLSLLLDTADVEGSNSRSYKIFEDGLRTVVYHSVRDVDYNSLNLKESVTCVYLPSSGATESPTTTTNKDSPRQGENMSAKDIVQNLSERFNVHHLMVEGGPVTAKLFLQEEVVDRVILVRAPLCFRQPLDAGISSTVLETAGLQFLGLVTSENVDQIECWSRPGSPWPTEELGDWP
jgi:riboflavin biosynthesis pyrimidine reductase